jgi:hypothetical protein
MVFMTVQLHSLEETEAVMRWAGAYTMIDDRPEGKGGVMWLGFNATPQYWQMIQHEYT